jgi:hypothetical protein
LRFCAYCKEEHDDSAFSGKNRYCRFGLNEYRKKKRAELKEKMTEHGWECPACRRLTDKPRKNAKRCQACVNSRIWRCACGRKSLGDPTCGKCRYKARKDKEDDRRQRRLARALPVSTGDGRCANCGRHLERHPNGTVKPHVCTP